MLALVHRAASAHTLAPVVPPLSILYVLWSKERYSRKARGFEVKEEEGRAGVVFCGVWCAPVPVSCVAAELKFLRHF